MRPVSHLVPDAYVLLVPGARGSATAAGYLQGGR